ncbi:YchJ family protein [Modicisalibacter coralii]|uniref:YchJ family protein n=1 Tax=Modicisalibacter coralii TaxID=2304602 RepID=UPI001F383D08|nr:YchJ family metal-binding protein [Halomonas coralii]
MKSTIELSAACPCGSQRTFAGCCAPVLQDLRRAHTPEALMRARYSAFVIQDTAFLQASWDPATRPPMADLEASAPRWCRLTVIDSEDAGDGTGRVRFTAVGRESGGFFVLTESSRFRFDSQADHWRYVDGDADWRRLDVGRNAPCPCASGLKAKRCCARD